MTALQEYYRTVVGYVIVHALEMLQLNIVEDGSEYGVHGPVVELGYASDEWYSTEYTIETLVDKITEKVIAATVYDLTVAPPPPPPDFDDAPPF